MSKLCAVCLIVVTFTVAHGTFITRKFTAKPEFDNKISNNDLLRQYGSQSMIECALNCQRETSCTFFGYNPSLNKCRVHKRTFTSGTLEETGWEYFFLNRLPVDCKDLHDNGNTDTGVYKIYPFEDNSLPILVYCDMNIMEGGWTAIQKRQDGSLSFDRNWTGL
ncbi:angiopoietin-4-like [Saccostrea cucullata]|uniref:angiopoietin-4-like n=1 Tax=Saccostrea cuccullata TaxID=36930 RepID=UPI002ED58F0C